MNINKKLIALAVISLMSSNHLLAQDAGFGNWTVTGSIRQDFAIKTTNDQNAMNPGGNSFNGVVHSNKSTADAGLILQVPALVGTPLNAVVPTITRPAAFNNDKRDTNLNATQFKLNFDGKLNDNWSASIKLRAYQDNLSENGSSMQQSMGAGSNGGSLGQARSRSLVDFPGLYLDYNNGPTWLRFGNQQIAWGEAVFFRISDLANGLDLRRHTVLDVASEEFSDTRVSSPGIRANYRFSEASQIEGFVQKFAPTILPNAGSSYNVIASQFIVDQSGYNEAKNELNVGFRFQGKLDSVDAGYQLFAVNRNNPDGVYRWTLAQGPTAIPGAPFSAAGAGANGVYHSAEWFQYAALSRLDGIGALQTAINQFPTGMSPSGGGGVSALCGASNPMSGNTSYNNTQAACTLDTFFSGGPLHGWIAREYKRESVFGFGVNKVFSGELDSITDQLIARFEASYTPNKIFTNPTLDANFLTKNDLNTALILEKYHKFSSDIPATYMVFQWMHRSASDIFGRALAGNNNIPGSSPTGQSGADYIAVVMQQPTPTLAYRFDLTMLTDLKGGYLFQPGVKWKIDKSLQADAYLNIIENSKNDGTSFTQTLKYGNEAFVRLTAFF